MDRSEYDKKLDNILNEKRKFQRLSKDPTNELRTKVLRPTEYANKMQNEIKFPKIIGDFKSGYCYGTIKTHKLGNPIRPILSQITSATYQLAKKLREIRLPYFPSKCSVKSSSEFIDLLHNAEPEEDTAPLDVQSLFTNVPVDETIDLILDHIYHFDPRTTTNTREDTTINVGSFAPKRPLSSHTQG
ncbi:uncharacterized protein [Macrobrachium rosenbergii]|uniref:uncharacterized protein n=1 Tax=Macrobrachium rosenbergii TaxID=79674 RepID=UPI0034D69641